MLISRLHAVTIMYSVDCTPTWIVPVDAFIRSASTSTCLADSGGTSFSNSVRASCSAFRISSFAFDRKGGGLAGSRFVRRPSEQPTQRHTLEQGASNLYFASESKNTSASSSKQSTADAASSSLNGVTVSAEQALFLSGKHTDNGSGKHTRLSPSLRGHGKKIMSGPYISQTRLGNIPTTRGSTYDYSANSRLSANLEVSAPISAANIEGKADYEREGNIFQGGAEGNGALAHGYALQEALTCVVASGRSAELLIWGVRCLIERDFPCLYTRPRDNALSALVALSMEERSVAKRRLSAKSSLGGTAPAAITASSTSSPLQTPLLWGGMQELVSSQGTDRTHIFNCIGASGALLESGQEEEEQQQNCTRGKCDNGSALYTETFQCSCNGGNCYGRQVVVVSVEGHRQRDRRVLKWVRHNVLRSGDLVILVIAWERAEEPKYLRVPGMILSSSVDAATYNLGMATRLTTHLKQLGAALLSDCRVYSLVVPLARVNKAPVGSLLCQSAKELQADVLVVGSHGHTSLRQVLCGSVSRHVRSHAPCKVVMPRV